MKTLLANRKYFVLILVVILMGFGIQSSYGQTITASVQQPLTEANLHGSIVTLTLSGGTYERSSFTIERALMVSGIDGVTIADFFGVDRVSDTEVTVELEFTSNIDANGTLTFTVGADAIAGYSGNVLTATVPVTALQESLAASTASSLTEANLDGSVVTLTLTGRVFEQYSFEIEDALTVLGIAGVTVARFGVDRVSDAEVTVELAFDGDFDTDGTLTFTVGADAVAGYDEDFTAQFAVTALEESLTASTEFPLTEATLNESVITLTLTGRNYEPSRFTIESAMTISGIDGVTIADLFGIERVSDTEVTVELAFDGDFDTDATLTFTVGADAVAGYSEDFTVQVSVTAIEQSNATVSVSPASVQSPDVGEELTFSLNIANGVNIAGYQAIVLYDRTALRFVDSTKGDYLAADGFFLRNGGFFGDVTLVANTLEASNGAGTLVTLTFEVIDFKASTLTLSQLYLVDSDGKRWEATTSNGVVTIPPEPTEETVGDINRDSVVDILDLTIVGARFGQRGQNSADVNGDGLVDIVDLVLVASEFGGEAAAPSLYPQAFKLLTATEVRQWLSQAEQLTLTDPTYLRGIAVLEQLHAALAPQETALLPNYPNPFNPETWIPYRLAEDALVTLTIYDQSGRVVRTLDAGHQIAGYYTDRTKAAYWDGKNEFSEQVASGVYFYHLSAGDYSATRKMLILK